MQDSGQTSKYSEKIWKKSWDPGLKDLDPEVFDTSIVEAFKDTFENYADSLAFSFMGLEINFGVVETRSNQFANMLIDNGFKMDGDRIDFVYSKVRFFDQEDYTRALEWLKQQRYLNIEAFIRELWRHKNERANREESKKDNEKWDRWKETVFKNKEHGCDNDHQCVGCPANDPENITCHVVLDACAKGLAESLGLVTTLFMNPSTSNHDREKARNRNEEIETDRMKQFGF